MESALAEAPIRHLYVKLPSEGLLQMCVMRPEPDDLCSSELPFQLPPPGAPPTLREVDLAPKVISAKDLLCHDLASSSHPPSVLRTTGAPSGAECAAIIQSAERSAALGSTSLPALARLQPDQWVASFAGSSAADTPFHALDARALQHVLRSAGSESLCDLLLQHALPRLLQQCARDATTPQLEAAIGDAEPLPAELSELLQELLHSGTWLRRSAADFDECVVHVLRNADATLGGRAAAQAALVFAVAQPYD